MIVDQSGLLNAATFIFSPNYDNRPADTNIDLIVIHGISLPPGVFGGPWINLLFTNKLDPAAHPSFQELINVRLSTHLFINRCGTILQYVPFHLRAWHAGESSYDGKPNCNDYSIGIELEGHDYIPYDDRQYQKLVSVIFALRSVYPQILPDRITSHSDIAPSRKTDPGPAFDWHKLYFGLNNFVSMRSA